MKIQATGIVNNGLLKIHNRKVFDAMLVSFNGKQVTIEVKRSRKIRSNPQNKYYRGCVIPAIQMGLFETQGEWLTDDETHEFLKRNFNYKEIVSKSSDKVMKIGLTTTDLSTIEFEEYLDKCRQFSNEFLNIIIPLPNEQATIEL